MYTKFDANDYQRVKQKIYLLGIYEQKEFDNEKEIKDRMLELSFYVMEFLGEEFNITSIQLIYICLNGEFSLEKNTEENLKEILEELAIEIKKENQN